MKGVSLRMSQRYLHDDNNRQEEEERDGEREEERVSEWEGQTNIFTSLLWRSLSPGGAVRKGWPALLTAGLREEAKDGRSDHLHAWSCSNSVSDKWLSVCDYSEREKLVTMSKVPPLARAQNHNHEQFKAWLIFRVQTFIILCSVM